MSTVPRVTHAIERTSLFGAPFVGTCSICGTPELTVSSFNEPCPRQDGLTQEDAVMRAIDGDEDGR